ncbi:hypothetical protein ACRRS0_09940 [Agarivorans sp. QJM3NY_29]|uniref:hypothetical protein n=1 Tax=unclassified Agarivorans TaxID=2636026 RepID=UPI003D7F1859
MISQQKTMLKLVAVFLVPILLAWLVLKMGWFERGTLSHGEWLEPPVQLSDYPQGKWSIAQVVAKPCEQDCLQQFQLLSKAWMALGIAKQKTQRLALLTKAAALDEASSLVEGTQIAALSLANNQQQAWAQYDQRWLVVDPTGWVIMSYQPQQGYTQVKGLISDLQRLIKNSRYQ